jgi:hypothetical protein
MSDPYCLTDEQMVRLQPFFSQEPWQASGR